MEFQKFSVYGVAYLTVVRDGFPSAPKAQTKKIPASFRWKLLTFGMSHDFSNQKKKTHKKQKKSSRKVANLDQLDPKFLRR